MDEMISNRLRKIIAFVLLIGFIVMLIPTLYIAQYNHPCADDYSYGTATKTTYEETGSVVKTIGTAFKAARDTYYSWQGTFTGVIAMCLGPYVFNIEWYDASTYILLGFFIAGTSFLMYKIVVSYLKADIWTYIITNVIVLMVSIEFVPYPTHSFFWYNGSILYTSFYSLALIVYGLIIGLLRYDGKNVWKKYILLLPLIFITGLGNFVVSLNLTIVMSAILLFMLVFKKKKYSRIIPLLIIAITALIIIVLAPGNTNRQSFHEGYSALEAIVKSFQLGFDMVMKPHAFTYNKIFVLIGVLVVLTFLIKYISKMSFRFKYPWIVLIVSFCIMCAMFTPPVYAFGKVIMPERIVNIQYFTFVWFVFINIMYTGGYIYKDFEEKQFKIENIPLRVLRKGIMYFYIALMLIGFSRVYSIKILETKKLPLCLRSSIVIIEKTGVVYDKEYHERLDELLSDDMNLVFESYTFTPDVLYYTDIEDDKTAWSNIMMSRFFYKDSVTLISDNVEGSQ